MKYTTLSLQEILARWKLLHGWEPLSPAAVIATPQLDALLELEIESWYTSLLAELPPEQLPVEEFAETSILSGAQHGYLTLDVPRMCLRPVSVKLAQWSAPAAVVPQSPELTIRQHNPFTAATADSPVAMEMPHGQLALYPATDEPVLESLLGVPAPVENIFLLTPAMMADMARTNLLSNLKQINTI